MMDTPGAGAPMPPHAGELLALLERLAEVTERALAAVRAGELSKLPPLIDQRDALLARAAPPLHELRLARRRSGAASPPGLAAALASVARAGRGLEALDRELAAGLSQRRGELSAALRVNGRAAAAHAAYSRPAPPSPATR